MTVNGQTMKAGKEQIIEPQVAAWMVTPTTTGYFVPKGHDRLVIKYGEQTTPSSAGMAAGMAKETAAKAYLHHGVKPEKKSYQFMVVPGTTSEQMKELAKKQEQEKLFKVITAQDSVHIVKYLPTSTIAYALFAPVSDLSAGVVCASKTELLVMERPDKSGSGLELALCNPNLRPKTIGKNNWRTTPTEASIELKGKWAVKSGDESQKITLEENAAGNTVLKTVLSEGMPVYVSLVK